MDIKQNQPIPDSVFEEVSEKLHTAKDYIRWGASQFGENELGFGHGMDNALDEAVYLVLKTLHLPVDTPESYWQTALLANEKRNLFECIQKRVNDRMPSAYITNEGWFAGLPFYVDERVLIPRSPIAELVETHFAPWLDPESVETILDMATGSGCIGIACAYAFPMASIDITDISDEALDVANINIDRHDVSHRVTAIKSDIFSAIPNGIGTAEKQYDLIVTNPPYVDEEDMQALSDEFKHEPELALASGKDGLDFTHQLLIQAANYLTEEGVLVVEVGNSQFELQHQYPDVPFHWFEFERGGDGVFLLTKAQLLQYFHGDSHHSH